MASTPALPVGMSHGARGASRGQTLSYGPALITLKKREEFTRLRGGARWSGPAFVLEGKARLPTVPILGVGQGSGPRFGFTITKKIGKAHERNRMRRRLSHALRSTRLPSQLETWDCVIVARRPALDRPFADLVRDFETALKRLSRPPPHGVAPPPKPRQDSTRTS